MKNLIIRYLLAALLFLPSVAQAGFFSGSTDAGAISGVVTVIHGGTGAATLADGGIVVGNGTSAVEVVAPGATTEILVGGGAATNPVWTTATGSGAPVRAVSPALTGTPIVPTASDNVSTTQAASTAFVKQQIASDTNSRGPPQSVALTAAASGSSGITVADSDHLDFGTGNFTPYFNGLVPDFTPAANLILMQKWATNVGYELGITATTGTLYLKLNTTTYTSSAAPVATDGTKHKIAAVVTVGAVNTTVDFYFDAAALGTQQTAANPGTVSNAAALYILGTSAVRTAGSVSDSGTFNRALSAAEVLDLYRNGVAEADKWGSQTELITAQVDRDFSGAGNWAAGGTGASIDTTGDLTVTCSQAGGFAKLAAANFGTPIKYGKKYRLNVNVANISGSLVLLSESFGAMSPGIAFANATSSYEFTSTSVADTGIVIYANLGAASADFDNFTLTEIGATLALTPEGIQPDKWYDSSSNALDGAYPTVGWTLTRQPSKKRIKQPTPTAETTAVTLTIAKLLTGIITATHAAGATQAYTLPTGALIDAWPAFGINDYFDWVLINLSAAAADTVTVTADTGHTIIGNPIVQSAHSTTGGIYGNSAGFRTRKTAAETFVTYRIN